MDQVGGTRNEAKRPRVAGVSPRMAIALERLGWSDAGHWVRMQGAYDLAQARRKLDAVA